LRNPHFPTGELEGKPGVVFGEHVTQSETRGGKRGLRHVRSQRDRLYPPLLPVPTPVPAIGGAVAAVPVLTPCIFAPLRERRQLVGLAVDVATRR